VDCVSEDGYFSISSRMRKYSPNSSGFNTYVTGKSTVITSLVGF
jgi:hypothetical protein